MPPGSFNISCEQERVRRFVGNWTADTCSRPRTGRVQKCTSMCGTAHGDASQQDNGFLGRRASGSRDGVSRHQLGLFLRCPPQDARLGCALSAIHLGNMCSEELLVHAEDQGVRRFGDETEDRITTAGCEVTGAKWSLVACLAQFGAVLAGDYGVLRDAPECGHGLACFQRSRGWHGGWRGGRPTDAQRPVKLNQGANLSLRVGTRPCSAARSWRGRPGTRCARTAHRPSGYRRMQVAV